MKGCTLFASAFTTILIIALSGCLERENNAQSNPSLKASADRFQPRPKLVVGITVDQMRHDYLYRYWPFFGEGGFKRLINDGFVCSNHHFDFAPTYTGPGHAAIFTGTTPAYNGIIANDWYDRSGRMVYCAGDTSARGVGTESPGGQMSPHRLLTTTLSDELRLSNNFKSKVIGVSLKDRGAILPAGHAPNGAYWFIGKDEGRWVTSDWYTPSLPEWVAQFNASYALDSCLEAGWELLHAPEVYSISYDDNNPYETPFKGQARAAFPYDFSDIELNRYDLLKATPFGATITTDFAMAAIVNEKLGDDDHTDLLALSYSNTDYAGHQFGPQAVEMQDTYLRLDQDIERLLNFLDREVGDNEYLIFLSADHGGAPVPSYMQSLNMPGGYWKPQSMLDEIDQQLASRYGAANYVSNYSNDQLFFNRELIESRRIDFDEIATFTAQICKRFPEVYDAYTTKELNQRPINDPVIKNLNRGIHPVRSGDVIVLTHPGFIEYGFRGTTHGSPFCYDTHVPLIFYGAGIKPGELTRRTHITDIAPTVARLMRISAPTASIGNVIYELCD